MLGLRNICYQDRLKLCSLEPLETRHLHADLILMYRSINGTIHLDLHNCVSISYSTTRGNKYKLTKYHAKIDIRKYFLPLELLMFETFYIITWSAEKTAHGFIVKLKSLELTLLKEQDFRPKYSALIICLYLSCIMQMNDLI